MQIQNQLYIQISLALGVTILALTPYILSVGEANTTKRDNEINCLFLQLLTNRSEHLQAIV